MHRFIIFFLLALRGPLRLDDFVRSPQRANIRRDPGSVRTTRTTGEPSCFLQRGPRRRGGVHRCGSVSGEPQLRLVVTCCTLPGREAEWPPPADGGCDVDHAIPHHS